MPPFRQVSDGLGRQPHLYLRQDKGLSVVFYTETAVFAIMRRLMQPQYHC
ncbi:oxidoreductase [Neisseria subflava]|nr:oxidoreductase [Neisseria subflava]